MFIKRQQMEKVDSYAIKRIKLEHMMPLAGQRLAEFLQAVYPDEQYIFLIGRGNNGGGGIHAIDSLITTLQKKNITVILTYSGSHKIKFADKILRKLNVKFTNAIPPKGIIIDCLLGYTLKEKPRGVYEELISQTQGRKIVSLDVPSGLNTKSGTFYDSHIKATYTLCLDIPKHGLENERNVFIADIGFAQTDYDTFFIEYTRSFVEPIIELQNS